MVTRTTTITDPVGIHARPAAKFAQAATASGCTVTIAKQGGNPVPAGSILSIMGWASSRATPSRSPWTATTPRPSSTASSRRSPRPSNLRTHSTPPARTAWAPSAYSHPSDAHRRASQAYGGRPPSYRTLRAP